MWSNFRVDIFASNNISNLLVFAVIVGIVLSSCRRAHLLMCRFATWSNPLGGAKFLNEVEKCLKAGTLNTLNSNSD